MKLGRTFSQVREAFDRAGLLDRALYVERATTDRQRTAPLAEVDPETVPYFSLALLPSPLTGELPAPARPGDDDAHTGELVVVGLGPGDRCWTTPEAADALAAADDLVGYGPYLDRVAANPRQVRHPSDNRVEADRAAHALELAQSGRRVAVVSSGDPGVFAMAAAVLEVAAQPAFADVPVRVVPGLTAAQAVASKVGAPLGHDFCVLSLSDVLKPWDVVLDRLRHAAAADLVIAVYNPRSKHRPHQLGEAQKALLEFRSPDTVVVVGRDVGGPEERLTVTTLGELDPGTVDMRCLVLIGSSRTRVDPVGRVWTPRTYPA
jgi:precorrin-2 C20-methyltransferase/precorrin-3B C17-methyltransferase